jgi:nucleoside-diphosphate-sugar epimerase
MATILLTGVTGAVGSSLAPLLKERGHKLICLIRGDNPVARLEKVLRYVGDIVVFNGDVTQRNLGVCDCEVRQWWTKKLSFARKIIFHTKLCGTEKC